MRTMWGMAVKACDHPRSRLLNGVLSVGPCPTAWPTGWTALQATLLDVNAVPTTAVKNSVAAVGSNAMALSCCCGIQFQQISWRGSSDSQRQALPYLIYSQFCSQTL
jgi:hypothetical protein